MAKRDNGGSEREEITVLTESKTDRGIPFLLIPTDQPKYPLGMGVRKCKAVLANLEGIRAFVAKHDKPESGPVNMATLAAAVGRMTDEERAKLRAALGA